MSLIRFTAFEAAVDQGNAYFFSSFTVLNNNEIFEITITAPAGAPPTIGLALDIDPSGQLDIVVFRDTVLNVVPGGTILTLNNQNGASDKTADTVVRRNPTIDTDGTQIANRRLASGHKNTGGVETSGAVVLEAEDKTVLVRMASGGSNNTVNFLLQVIEEQS